MAKWCGKIGFENSTETIIEVDDNPQNDIPNGVWTESIVEITYYGDFNRVSRRLQSSGNLNDNVTVSNELSIVADPFANNNYQSIRYAEFMGAKWKITNIEVQRPRLILTLGEVYNG